METEDCGKNKITDNDKLEYQEGIKLWQDDSRLRRQGLTFCATVQGIIMAVLSRYNGDNSLLSISLEIFAMIVALLCLNNDRRLSRYMGAYETRLIEIEKKNDLRLVHIINDVAKKRTSFLSNEFVFATFYTLLAIGWGSCIIWSLWILLK